MLIQDDEKVKKKDTYSQELSDLILRLYGITSLEENCYSDIKKVERDTDIWANQRGISNSTVSKQMRNENIKNMLRQKWSK